MLPLILQLSTPILGFWPPGTILISWGITVVEPSMVSTHAASTTYRMGRLLISVRMESVGSSSAKFENQFQSAGINQTNHQIILKVDVKVSILLPGYTTATTVSTAVTVAETVVVGAVPETYTYFSTALDTYEEDLKDYILNNS